MASFASIGLFSTAFSLFDVIFPDIISNQKIGITTTIITVSILYGGWRSWPRPIEQEYASPNVKIKLEKGNLFDQPGHLVIGMTTTFDTSIPNIIARSSIQGQFLDKVFSGDIRELDAQLKKALSPLTPVGTIEKAGKKTRYPIGTVATLKNHARRYFCVAYTEMNEQNEARGTVDGIWRSLDNLWKVVCRESNGGRVSIPVIGGGQSRLSQILPAQDSIRFTALSFMLACRKEKICDELAIIVQPKDYDRLDRLEIQSFLKSLKAS